MISRCIFYVIKFLLLLKFGRTTFFEVISRNHGSRCRKLIFRCVDLKKKLAKCDLDIDFLTTCKTYNIFPKFLRFKLYRKSLQTSEAYKTFQNELLANELSSKTKRAEQLRKQYGEIRDRLRVQLSFFEMRMFNLHEHEILETFVNKCKITHQKKLQNLGIYNRLIPCDPDRVIPNLSSKPLPDRIKTLLAFGLEFKLPVWKLNFFHYHLSFEKVLNSLSYLPLREGASFDGVKRGIVSICRKYFQSFDASKVF